MNTWFFLKWWIRDRAPMWRQYPCKCFPRCKEQQGATNRLGQRHLSVVYMLKQRALVRASKDIFLVLRCWHSDTRSLWKGLGCVCSLKLTEEYTDLKNLFAKFFLEFVKERRLLCKEDHKQGEQTASLGKKAWKQCLIPLTIFPLKRVNPESTLSITLIFSLKLSFVNGISKIWKKI